MDSRIVRPCRHVAPGSSLRVLDVMTRAPMVIHREDRAEPLLTLLEGQDFTAVPVADTEGDLLGMVTELSLLAVVSRTERRDCRGGASSSLRARDSMDTRKVSVEPQTTSARCAADDSVPRPERAGRRAIRDPAAAS
jgi:CBS-domain-containing membrane protein